MSPCVMQALDAAIRWHVFTSEHCSSSSSTGVQSMAALSVPPFFAVTPKSRCVN